MTLRSSFPILKNSRESIKSVYSLKCCHFRKEDFIPHRQKTHEIQFKVAETHHELEQAYRLLHDSYVSEGLMTPHPSGLRVTKYHALPSTWTLIATENEKVIATVSVVRKAEFGLPLETAFDITALPADARLAEVSALAIAPPHRRQRARILFPLMKFMFHCSQDYMDITHLTIAVNPKSYAFYESTLKFTALAANPVHSYDFVEGAPAMAGILRLNDIPLLYKDAYAGLPLEKDLSHFFLERRMNNMHFPKKEKLAEANLSSANCIEYFFFQKTDAFSLLTPQEQEVIEKYYSSSRSSAEPKPYFSTR